MTVSLQGHPAAARSVPNVAVRPQLPGGLLGGAPSLASEGRQRQQLGLWARGQPVSLSGQMEQVGPQGLRAFVLWVQGQPQTIHQTEGPSFKF